jgi:hypothetical protein
MDASFSSILEWKFASRLAHFPDNCGKSLAVKHLRADHLITNQVIALCGDDMRESDEWLGWA